VKAQGLVEPWSAYWERGHRYGLEEEVDANHLTINTHPRAVTATRDFFADTLEP
jgi:hypothetical protein